MSLPKKIYLIRHGQTDYNLRGIVQGSGVDSDLNATGQAQAAAFFEAYRHVAFDKVYISALKRTYQSVRPFIEELHLPYESHAGLNEISWGHREGQAITPEENAYYYSVLDAWANGQTDLPIAGGESPDMVRDRQQPVLDLILSRPEERTILVCMHGRAMRVLLSLMLNYELRCMDMFEHANLGLYVLTHTGSSFSVDMYNDTAHLKDLAARPMS